MEGTLLMEGVGLFMTGTAFWSGTCAKLDWVAALEADMLRAGDTGRAGWENGEGDGAGGGAIVPLLLLFDWFEGCRAIAGTAGIVVGVACGVDAAELALATEMGVGVCRAMLGGGWWTVPSSPGAKVRAEQKPSDEVIRRVWPSLDQVKSVKVA
jgi:hypothetical protein